ncbi:Phosphoribosyl-AMP cyclohydrolase, partial [hydrothermal vent metagenome]
MNLETLRFDDRGLIPCVVQDDLTGAILMVAWMNAEAIELTETTGDVHFWSRSRNELWRKGATSGNTLRLVSITEDCDADTLLVRATPAGPICHTGATTCF